MNDRELLQRVKESYDAVIYGPALAKHVQYIAKCEEMMCAIALVTGKPIGKVTAICKEVCTHYPDRSIDTLAGIYIGLNVGGGEYYRDYLETEKKLEDAQS